jgi:hypothetical protein
MSESSGIQQIEIGAKVSSKDGRNLGHVSKLIIQGGSGHVGGFLMDPGLVGAKRIVDLIYVESANSSGITLKLNENDAENLPQEIHEQRVRAPGTMTVPTGFGGIVTTTGSGNEWYLRGEGGGQLPHTGYDSIIPSAPIGNIEVENLSNLPDDSLLITEHTEVFGSDGKKIGHVERIVLNEEQVISGIVIKTGWLHKHEFQIPLSLVQNSSDKTTHLNVPRSEVEKYEIN